MVTFKTIVEDLQDFAGEYAKDFDLVGAASAIVAIWGCEGYTAAVENWECDYAEILQEFEISDNK